MALRSLSDIVSHFFGSMYPRQMYFTGSSHFDRITIRGLFSLPYSRSAEVKIDKGDSECARRFPTSKPATLLFCHFTAIIKLCRIKGKIKGGWEPFPDRINKRFDISRQIRGPRL